MKPVCIIAAILLSVVAVVLVCAGCVAWIGKQEYGRLEDLRKESDWYDDHQVSGLIEED